MEHLGNHSTRKEIGFINLFSDSYAHLLSPKCVKIEPYKEVLNSHSLVHIKRFYTTTYFI